MRCDAEVEPDPRQGRRGARRAARLGRRLERRNRRLERRFGLDLSQSRCPPRRGGAGPTASWSGALFDGPVRLVFRDASAYPEVGHHTILLGPRYRELLADIFQRRKLADDFSLYLHRPTATDPSLAPPGCDAFYVLSPVPNLRGGQDWAVEAEPYRAGSPPRWRPRSCPASPSARDLAGHDPARLPRPAQFLPGRRLRPRADPDPERLVPAA